ncbi:hypothetical protein U1Q18_040305 [Sarracenia purpurea var. burkii]
MEASSRSQSLEEITSPTQGMREGWSSKGSGSKGVYEGFGEDKKVDEVADDVDRKKRAFGHETGKCKANKKPEGKGEWVKVSKGKEKVAEVQVVEPIQEGSNLEMGGTSAAGIGQEALPTLILKEQAETENKGKDEGQEPRVFNVEEDDQDPEEDHIDIIAGNFDSPSVSPNGPPDKKQSSSKKKKKR